jgi:hypothetical protein
MANDLGVALFAWASTALAGVLTVGGEFQFYPIAAQESKNPPVAYYEEDIDASEQIQDRSPSVQISTVRFACVGASPPEAKAISDALYHALIEIPNGGFDFAMGTVHVHAVICRKRQTPAYQWEEQQFAVDAEYKISYTL